MGIIMRYIMHRMINKFDHVVSLRYSFASSWPVGFDQQFLWSVSVAFPHPRSFGVLEAVCQSSSRVCEDIVAAIECPQEDIDFDAILRPYYDTTTAAAYELKEQQQEQQQQPSDSCCNSTTTAANRVETVIVKIPEPNYYEEFRSIHEREFVDRVPAANSIRNNELEN